MSPSDAIDVMVETQDGVAEIAVTGAGFEEVARGVGRVEFRAEPGFYRARSFIGHAAQEKLFAVEPGSAPVQVLLPAVEFESPMPLQGTTTSHEYHMGKVAYAYEVRTAASDFGAGGCMQIFFCDPGEAYRGLGQADLDTYAAAFRGFELTDWTGTASHHLEFLGELAPEDGSLFVRVDAAPGAYVLQGPVRGNERLAMPLVVFAGWSTALFANLVPGPDGGLDREVDLDGAAIVLQQTTENFNPDSIDLKLLETARRALEHRRRRLDRASMNRLLGEKFDNPMMGLMAAHLLLLRSNPNVDSVATVLGNVGNLIGEDGADLAALRWKHAQVLDDVDGQREHAEAIASSVAPPMFQLSFEYMQAAAKAVIRTTSAGPFAFAANMVSSGVWTRWLMPADVAQALAANAWADAHSRDDDVPRQADGLRDLLDDIDLSHLRLATVRSFDFQGLMGRLSGALGPDAVDDMTQMVEQLILGVDWDEVVTDLKRRGESPLTRQTLSPRQRYLLLALKDAQELFTAQGTLDRDELHRWLQGVGIEQLNRELPTLIDLSRLITDRSSRE